MQNYILAALLFVLSLTHSSGQKFLKGAWQNQDAEISSVRIYTESFFSVSEYKKQEFVSTYGGKYKSDGNSIVETIEFDTKNPERVGKEIITKISRKGKELTFNGQAIAYRNLDDGSPGKLAGAWLITGRFNNNEMSKITPAARRTMKILSGTRFQWIAYNIETKEFFGTGGGNYTSENGQYTENIDFFSRDNSRAGASLGFNFSIQQDGGWRHQGKSSKGDPIDEVWTQREKLGM